MRTEQAELETVGDAGRRAAVLDSALTTFARFGYRKTSMQEVARAARISRPGLYFLFSSKELLFRAAVERGLQNDIDAVVEALDGPKSRVKERLLAAFDAWSGRYVGPLARDVTAVIDDNPDLLGDITTTAPKRFEELVLEALSSIETAAPSEQVVQTLISAAVGVKHQVDDRSEFIERMRTAIEVIVR